MQYMYWDDKCFEEGLAIEEAFMNGEIVEFESLYDKMIRSKYGEIDNAAALENLNIVYDYLKDNLSLITVTYKDIYPEISDEKLLIYYISRLGVEEIERVKALAFK